MNFEEYILIKESLENVTLTKILTINEAEETVCNRTRLIKWVKEHVQERQRRVIKERVLLRVRIYWKLWRIMIVSGPFTFSLACFVLIMKIINDIYDQ